MLFFMNMGFRWGFGFGWGLNWRCELELEMDYDGYWEGIRIKTFYDEWG